MRWSFMKVWYPPWIPSDKWSRRLNNFCRIVFHLPSTFLFIQGDHSLRRAGTKDDQTFTRQANYFILIL